MFDSRYKLPIRKLLVENKRQVAHRTTGGSGRRPSNAGGVELEKNLEDQGFNDQGGRGQGFGDPHFGEEGSDDRSSEAMGYSFASLGISIALEMVVPGVLGYLLDRQLGFRACFVLVGFGLGFGLGMWHLVKFAQRTGRKSSQ